MKKITLSLLLGLSLIFNFSSCVNNEKANNQQNGQHLKGRISLSGAFALYPLAVKWGEEFRKMHPDVRFEVEGGGAGKGMTDVLAGQVEFGMVSRDISEVESAKGAIGFPVAKDAVIPTINAENPFYADLIKHGISLEQAKGIWIDGTIKTWGQLLGTSDQTPIQVFTRSDACGVAETWAKYLGKHQEDLHGEGVNSEPGLITAVKKSKLAIGINNISYVYETDSPNPLDGIRAFPIDLNGNGQIDPDEDFYENKDTLIKAVSDGKYPSPPARDMYLVTKGKPTDPVIVEFLKYVLTEGQKFNGTYIPMPQDKLDKALEELSK